MLRARNTRVVPQTLKWLWHHHFVNLANSNGTRLKHVSLGYSGGRLSLKLKHCLTAWPRVSRDGSQSLTHSILSRVDLNKDGSFLFP